MNQTVVTFGPDGPSSPAGLPGPGAGLTLMRPSGVRAPTSRPDPPWWRPRDRDGFEGTAPGMPPATQTFVIRFDRPSTLHWITLRDLENCAFLRLFGPEGGRIGERLTVWSPGADPRTRRIGRAGVARMAVEIAGAGAIAAIGYAPAPADACASLPPHRRAPSPHGEAAFFAVGATRGAC